MIRKTLSLFLITAMLCNQAVACYGHTHGDSADHSSRAHIHLTGHPHGHGSDHHHHGGHHHDGDQQDDSGHQPTESDSPKLSPIDCFNHDDDAIYFSGQEQLLLASAKIQLKKSHCTATTPELAIYDYPHSCTQTLECSESESAFKHALFLQTSRLLI